MPNQHPLRISESDTPTDSHERTNVRTEMSDRTALTLKKVDAGRGENGFTSLGDIIDRGLWPTERHPVIRTGKRNEIPLYVRSAVWYRDHGRCELCTERSIDGPWHLDHIVPWSAGGSDKTTNLRVLCEKHNVERGNRIDPTERPRRAATWWCYRCYGRDTETWVYANGTPVACPIHRYSDKACPVKRGYKRAHELTGEWPTWHQSHDYMDEADAVVVAFCAHCGIPSLTDRPL